MISSKSGYGPLAKIKLKKSVQPVACVYDDNYVQYEVDCVYETKQFAINFTRPRHQAMYMNVLIVLLNLFAFS